MKQIVLALLCLACITVAHAQPFKETAAEQGLKGGVKWVKRTWYYPQAGTMKPDKTKVPNIYMSPNQLIQYGADGMLKSDLHYKPGTDDGSGATSWRYYKDGKLVKEVQENDVYEAIYTKVYTYDAAGNISSIVTGGGPGDKMGITADRIEIHSWVAGRLAKKVTLSKEGKVQSEITYSYDEAGRIIREDYKPGLFAAMTFKYDAKGNRIEEAMINADGTPSSVWTIEYDKAQKPVKKVLTRYYQGKKQSEEVTIMVYDDQGEKIEHRTIQDGKETSNYGWKHTYDAKGNRIETVHLKAGKPEKIEVLELRYY